MPDIKYTGRMCGRNRATCDTSCVLCVYHPAKHPTFAEANEGAKYQHEYFVIYCGCQVVEVRPIVPGGGKE